MCIHSIETAQKIGFKNISIDLIYSLPGQTIQRFKTNLGHVVHFGTTHYSAILLIIEPKTSFLSINEQREITYT